MMKRAFLTRSLNIICAGAAVYLLALADLSLRSRKAWLEAEKYYSWHFNPAGKKKFYEDEYAKTSARFEKEFSSGKISSEEFRRMLDSAAAERDRMLEESSVKHAYIWYKTAADVRAWPEPGWTGLSMKKMSVAKELWKKELKSRGIPVKDYMLE